MILRGRAVVVATTLALGGCLDQLLESPYVLAAGLGEVTSVSPGTDGRLLAATPTGVYAIDVEGKAERVGSGARAVSAHPGRTYELGEHGVGWWGPKGDGGITYDGPIVEVDVLAGYDELVTLTSTHVATWPLEDPTSGRVHPVPGARAVALGPATSYLVVTETALYRVDTEARALVTGLVDARAAAMDAKGRVYVAQGAPTELWRVEPDGRLTNIAKWLGDVRDMHFGVGPFPPENLYLANGAGTVDYVRPP